MNIIGIDTETTGLESDAGVCQLAVVLLDTVTWEIAERKSYLVNPEKPISESARRIHGISDDMVQGCPTLADLLDDPTLRDFFSLPVVFGHNVGYDIRMIGNEVFDHAQPLDTLPILRTCFPNWANHKLGYACDRLGITLTNAHDALADIEATAAILKHLHVTYGYGLERMVEISRNLKNHILTKMRNLR